jgi:hypothetical protein
MASMGLSIPKSHEPLVAMMAMLPNEQLEELADLLLVAEPSLAPEKLTAQLAARVKRLDPSSIPGIMKVVDALATTRDHNELSTRAMVDELAVLIRRDKLAELTDKKLEEFKGTLVRILDQENALSKGSRAQDLLWSYKTVLSSVRIVSDLRPVFSRDDGGTAIGALIVHNLELNVVEDDQDKVLYAAMDSHDLTMLRAAVDRAVLKERELLRIVKASRLRLFTEGLDDAQS